jgi:hypothetical protein
VNPGRRLRQNFYRRKSRLWETLKAVATSRLGESPNGVRCSHLALHSVPAQSPQPTDARCARGEELKATEFDCGASALLDRLAGGLVRVGIQQIEKVSDGRRLFGETRLFSRRHQRP